MTLVPIGTRVCQFDPRTNLSGVLWFSEFTMSEAPQNPDPKKTLPYQERIKQYQKRIEAPQNPARKKTSLTLIVLVPAALVCVVLSQKKPTPGSQNPAEPASKTVVEDLADSGIVRLCVETEPAGASLLVNGK